jgi:uncharacterized protein YndB with AHSA1/START domain
VSRSIDKRVTIEAPADVIWRALTDAEQLRRWFPVDARVTPGPGGSIWLSWGGGTEGEAPITAWEPERRLQWTESRGPVRIAVDFHIEGAGGRTVVRLVHSGFGDGPDWDDEFHMTDGGWSYFLQHLRWYVERHWGRPRDLVALREAVALNPCDAFAALAGPAGLSKEDSLRPLDAGTPYETTTATGDRLSGTIVAHKRETGQLGLTIAELGGAILFIEIEPHPVGARAGFWLSTYGLDAGRLAEARRLVETLYRQALHLPSPADRPRGAGTTA